ncbi:MAG: tail fiber domain-containing protein [Saprospiraceae bacterium]|nr:tail fiber domain-containing protein [Saprospiraceae bacterium]
MKKSILYPILAICLMSFDVNAQAPQKFSYQAVIRNGSNALIANTTVGVKISLLQSSPAGGVVYAERHTPTTNANGLATFEIGAGTRISGTMAGIDWGNGSYYIKTEVDPSGGTTYSVTGTSQLLSVPYALYAASGTQGPEGPIGPVGSQGPVVLPVNGSPGLLHDDGGNRLHKPAGSAFTLPYSGTTALSNGDDGSAFSLNYTGANLVALYVRSNQIGIISESSSSQGISGRSQSSEGVYGYSISGIGVHGYTGDNYGVKGESVTKAGVYGFSQISDGVYGEAWRGIGVQGISTNSFGVFGVSSNHHGIKGESSAATKAGVWGASTGSSSYGVYGSNSGTLGVGVYGISTSSIGVWGGNLSGTAFAMESQGGLGAYKNVGGNTWATPSDERLKKDIRPFTDGLNVILKIEPKRYYYNGMAKTNPMQEEFGIIAQDMQKIAPYTVSKHMLDMNKSGEEAAPKMEEMLVYNSGALTYVTINAIKEQQKMIERQSSIIEKQNEKIAHLEKQNEKLDVQNEKIKAQREELDVEKAKIKALEQALNEIKSLMKK